MGRRLVFSAWATALLAASLLATPAAAGRANSLPDGSHDGAEGMVGSSDECRASGWAIDPDTVGRPITVRVLVDDGETPIWSGVARLFREDVSDAGFGSGLSGFDTSLVGLIELGVEHKIIAQAQDLQTGEWSDLPGTPKLLTCPYSHPIGSHDGNEGTVSPDGCYAAGWAVDPDDPLADVAVRITIDGTEAWSGVAGDFRDDLPGAIPGDGTSAFTVNLVDLMTPDVEHAVRAEAQDLTTGEWVDLDGTPRSLTCSANHLPEGSHEGSTTEPTLPYWCFASGWVRDQDLESPYGVPLRILVDDEVVWSGYPGQFRATLESLNPAPPEGAAPFLVDLASLLSADEAHAISVEAQDVQTGAWVALADTPRTMTCVRVAPNADIYAYSTKTGLTEPVTATSDAGEFAPDWAAKDGSFVADREGYDPDGRMYHRLVVVDPGTRVATPGPGSDNANDAVVSPNGKWIAFDEYVAFEQYPPFPPCFACDMSIFLVPMAGGTPVWLAGNAATPDWSPHGDRLVFGRPGDDSIWTVDLKGVEHPLGVNGLLPAWSPDGHWIAYSWLGDLWKVAVNGQGKPAGDAIQLTSGSRPFVNDDFDPAWSPTGDTIYFASQRDGTEAIWKMPASGGTPTQVTHPVAGTTDTGPAVSRDGKVILFSRIDWR